MKIHARKSLSLFFIAALAHSGAYADAAAEIKYRESVMEVVGGHMQALGTMLKGRVHQEDLSFHAHGIANIASIVPHVFPAGSGEGKTEALSDIWEKPAEFKLALDKFQKAAKGIAVAADSGDMGKIGPAMKALGGSCKGCHDNFKED